MDVLSSPHGVPSDAGEAFSDVEHFNVVRLRDLLWQLHSWLSVRKGCIARNMDAMLLAVVWPCLAVLWVLQVARRLRNKKYDIVVCSIYPKSALLLPILLYKKLNASWVLDYQDSCSSQFKRYPRKSPIHRLFSPLLGFIEKSALDRVGCAVFTSESNHCAYVEDGLVAVDKTQFVSQFFEEDLYDRSLGWDGCTLNIICAGNFDRVGRRTPEIFLESLRGFIAKHPEAEGKVVFEFYGRWWPEHSRFIDECGLKKSIVLHSAVPYEEYLKLLQTSAVLLLVTSPVHNLFIPGKLTDYLGACRPILAFAPPDSETVAALRSARIKKYICSDADVSGGIKVLELIWADYCEKKLSGYLPYDVAEWSSEALAKRFVDCIKAD